jgi:hypothetical protein
VDRVAEIKRLYYATTKATLLRDLDRAIDLLKGIETEEERERAAVYMDGLSQMRAEWGLKGSSRQSAVGSRQSQGGSRQSKRR